MPTRWSMQMFFWLFLLVFTLGLAEGSFRLYDRLTMTSDNQNMDEWIKKTSLEVEDHPLLGYRRKPNQVINEQTMTDRYGMQNATEALAWDTVDIVGVGDSYMDLAHHTFYELFHGKGIKYHSLAIFGYGPGNYNILMREYGKELKPKIYVYSTYLGNDPGDIRRYETWQASGKGWYEHNGGYVFPIERQGLLWGWRLFMSRAKGFARNLISRINPGSYEAVRALVNRDDAETVFQYVLQAKELAAQQHAKLLVVIIPRTPDHKPLLDPIAAKVVNLCEGKGIMCLDLDPAFGDTAGRTRFFASDGHWNESGMNSAWAYLWNSKLQALVATQ